MIFKKFLLVVISDRLKIMWIKDIMICSVNMEIFFQYISIVLMLQNSYYYLIISLDPLNNISYIASPTGRYKQLKIMIGYLTGLIYIHSKELQKI